MNPYQDHTDTDLVILLKQGDRKAFEIIYRRYAADLYQYARRNISAKEDCEEIVQDVFESLWVRHTSLQITTLQFYLLKTVRYKIIRYFQHSAVRKRYAEHYRQFEVEYDTPLVAQDLQSATQSELRKCISELPEKWQTALKLRLNESLSNSEIAARMNIPKKTVEWYMFKAFSRIRSCYKPQEG